MTFDVLVLLFVAFGVISSLVNKWQQRQHDNERELRPRRSEPTPETEIPDLSEWDVFPEPEPVVEDREFREVRGARPVSEADVGREFREVQGTHTITESYSGPEYRDPLVGNDTALTEAKSSVDFIRESIGDVQVKLPRKKRKRRVRLRFDRNALVNAVLYKEILGKPRGEEMPW